MPSCTTACLVGGCLPSCELGMWQPCFQPQTLVRHSPTCSATSPHHVHPSATSGKLGTPMLTLTVSSVESWGPSPPTQLSPYPQLPAQVHPTHHPSIWHLSTSCFLTNWFLFPRGFKPTWGGPGCVVQSPASWMATPGLEVKQAFGKRESSPRLRAAQAALFLSPPWAGKSASSHKHLPMLLLTVSFRLDGWSFLSIAQAAEGPGRLGLWSPVGALGGKRSSRWFFSLRA